MRDTGCCLLCSVLVAEASRCITCLCSFGIISHPISFEFKVTAAAQVEISLGSMFDITFGVIYECLSGCKIYLVAVDKMSQSEHHSMSRYTAVPLFAMYSTAVSG